MNFSFNNIFCHSSQSQSSDTSQPASQRTCQCHSLDRKYNFNSECAHLQMRLVCSHSPTVLQRCQATCARRLVCHSPAANPRHVTFTMTSSPQLHRSVTAAAFGFTFKQRSDAVILLRCWFTIAFLCIPSKNKCLLWLVAELQSAPMVNGEKQSINHDASVFF